MTDARRHLTRDDLAALARAAIGPARRLTAVTRLRGGSKKGVYRLAFDDDSSAIAYVWSADEDYWSSGPTDDRDPFSHASGIDLFTAAHDRLTTLGIRTPHLLLADRTHEHVPADAVVVEDFRGGTLEDLPHRDPLAAATTMERLAETLRTMRGHRAARYGKVALVDNGGVSHGSSCEQVVRDRALSDLAEAAVRDARMGAVREALDDRLHELAGAVRPRTHPTLIHGELGPDHVLVDADGHPALIDIEGLMYFDAEWEHVFLANRFGDRYGILCAEGLDEDRLHLYRLAIHLSLVAGPLRLLDGDFPDRAAMRSIAEHNLGRTLTLLRNAS